MFKRFFSNRYGYSRWDGTQRLEGFDADEILDGVYVLAVKDSLLPHRGADVRR